MNCPCLNVAYGHIQDTVVKDVIQSKKFRLWGDIKRMIFMFARNVNIVITALIAELSD